MLMLTVPCLPLQPLTPVAQMDYKVTPYLLFHPAMTTGASTNFATNDGFEILPFGTPPIDVTQSYANPANTSDESCMIDQFLGIATAITLPETKMDLKRFHVVGLGRDVSVQAPGKFMVEGGSFEVNMHTARWLKYCLGKEAVHGSGEAVPTAIAIAAATSIDDANGTAVGQSSIPLDAVTDIVVGDYICITDNTETSVVSDHEPGTVTWMEMIFQDFWITHKQMNIVVYLR